MTHHLQLHRAKWRVRIVVPPELVAAVGKRFLLHPTGTADFDRAQRIAAPHIKKFLRQLDTARGKKSGRVHVRFTDWDTRSSEWYAPPGLFEKLPVVFDLDPCSPGLDKCWVPAKTCYTKEDDGLVQPWHGFCWVNPPFGVRWGMLRWLDRFVAHGNGVCFLAGSTYTRWWQTFAEKCDAVLFIKGYVTCVPSIPTGRKSRPSFGSCLFAIGERGVAALKLAEQNGLGYVSVNERRIAA